MYICTDIILNFLQKSGPEINHKINLSKSLVVKIGCYENSCNSKNSSASKGPIALQATPNHNSCLPGEAF